MKDKDQKTTRAETTERRPEGDRKPFDVPAITEHESLPVITAGSVNLWT